MPLIEDVPRYVVMISVPQQGETVHHTDTKAKLDSEWMPRFNQALKEHGLVGHVVVYQPSCQCSRPAPGTPREHEKIQIRYFENMKI